MGQTIAKCCHIVDGAVYRTCRQLGERFMRVHRAYIVNADRTRGVTAACVEVDGVRIEFLRKYFPVRCVQASARSCFSGIPGIGFGPGKQL